VIDTFRDMNVCDKLLSGYSLYKDVFYEYGFLPPFILKTLCYFFGLKIATFAGTGIGISLLISFLLYKISRTLMDRIGSTLVVLVYLFVIAFGLYDCNGIFNLIIPYSFASAMFICFVLAALYSFVNYILSRKLIFLCSWVLLQIMAFLCRPDMASAIWICFAGSLAIHCYFNIQRSETGRILSCTTMLLLPIFVSIVIYWLFFVVTGGWKDFELSCLQLVFSGVRKYLSSNMGMGSDTGNYLKLMIESVVVHGVGVRTTDIHGLIQSQLASNRQIMFSDGVIEGKFKDK